MPFQRSEPYNDLPDLPPAVNLETAEILKEAISSARALERLRGTAARLPNPRLLVNSIVLQEARLSTEIENIVTTSDELYRAAAGTEGIVDAPTKEVLRYREALWYGFEQIARRPLSTSLFVELVGMIRQTDAGLRSTPGTMLKNAQGEVSYTPPEGESVLYAKLANLERYIHSEDGLDPLIKLAITHYQFEAIHPFTDGNGRTGRILNVLYLVEKGLLDLPVLYLSQYILRNKAAYYAGLRRVTEEANWRDWVLYVLAGIRETSIESCFLIEALLEQMSTAGSRFRSAYPNVYSKDLFEVVFSNPYCRIRVLETSLGVSRPTATNYLQKLSQSGVLREQRIGRDLYFINDAMIAALTSERKDAVSRNM